MREVDRLRRPFHLELGGKGRTTTLLVKDVLLLEIDVLNHHLVVLPLPFDHAPTGSFLNAAVDFDGVPHPEIPLMQPRRFGLCPPILDDLESLWM